MRTMRCGLFFPSSCGRIRCGVRTASGRCRPAARLWPRVAEGSLSSQDLLQARMIGSGGSRSRSG